MSLENLISTTTKEKHVRTNTTVRISTFKRLDKLVELVIKRDPGTNRSKLLDAILVEKLDALGITLDPTDNSGVNTEE